MTTKLKVLLIFFIIFTLGYQVLAAPTSASYNCIPNQNLIGHWQFDLFDSEKGSNFNYQKILSPDPSIHDTIVSLTHPIMKDKGNELNFTSDEASLVIDHTKSTNCNFDTEGDNYCWEAKLTKIKDVNKDIGRKSIKDLINAKWICYGK